MGYLRSFSENEGSISNLDGSSINLKTADDYDKFYKVIATNFSDKRKQDIFNRTLWSIILYNRNSVANILSKLFRNDSDATRFDADLEKKKQEHERLSRLDPTSHLSSDILFDMGPQTDRIFDELKKNGEVVIEPNAITGASTAKMSIEKNFDILSRYAMAFEFYRYLKYSGAGRTSINPKINDAEAKKPMEFKDISFEGLSANEINAGFEAFINKILKISSKQDIAQRVRKNIEIDGPKEIETALVHYELNQKKWNDYYKDHEEWEKESEKKRGPEPEKPLPISEEDRMLIDKFYRMVEEAKLRIYNLIIEPYTKLEYKTYSFIVDYFVDGDGSKFVQIYPYIGDDVLKIDREFSGLVPNLSELNAKIDSLREMENNMLSLLRYYNLDHNTGSEQKKRIDKIAFNRDEDDSETILNRDKDGNLSFPKETSPTRRDDFKNWYIQTWEKLRKDETQRFFDSHQEDETSSENARKNAVIDLEDFNSMIRISTKLVGDSLKLSIKIHMPDGRDEQTTQFCETYFNMLDRYINANKLNGFPFLPFDEILYELVGQFDDVEVISSNPNVIVNCETDLTQFDGMSMETYLGTPDKDTVNRLKAKFKKPRFVYLDNIANLLASRSSEFFLLSIYDQLMRYKSPYRTFIMQNYMDYAERDASKHHTIESYSKENKLEDLLRAIFMLEFRDTEAEEYQKFVDTIKGPDGKIPSRKEAEEAGWDIKFENEIEDIMKKIAIDIIESVGGGEFTKPSINDMFDKCVDRVADDTSNEPYGYTFLFKVKTIEDPKTQLPKTPNDRIYICPSTGKYYYADKKTIETKNGKNINRESKILWAEANISYLKKMWYDSFFYSAFDSSTGKRILANSVFDEIKKIGKTKELVVKRSDKTNHRTEEQEKQNDIDLASEMVADLVMAVLRGELKMSELYGRERVAPWGKSKPPTTAAEPVTTTTSVTSTPAPSPAPSPTAPAAPAAPPAPAEPASPTPAPAVAPAKPTASNNDNDVDDDEVG